MAAFYMRLRFTLTEGRSIGPPLLAVPYSALVRVLEVPRHHRGDLRALGICARRDTVIADAVHDALLRRPKTRILRVSADCSRVRKAQRTANRR